MNKYYVEQYEDYYPQGGMNDMLGPFNSIDEAKEAADKTKENLRILEVKDNTITPIRWHIYKDEWIETKPKSDDDE